MECFGVLKDSTIAVKGIYIHLSVCFGRIIWIVSNVVERVLPYCAMPVIGCKTGYIIRIPLMCKGCFYAQCIDLTIGEAIKACVIFAVKMSTVQTAFLVCLIVNIISRGSQFGFIAEGIICS